MTFIYQKKTSVTHRDRQSMKVMKASALPEDDTMGESHIVGGRLDGWDVEVWQVGRSDSDIPEVDGSETLANKTT